MSYSTFLSCLGFRDGEADHWMRIPGFGERVESVLMSPRDRRDPLHRYARYRLTQLALGCLRAELKRLYRPGRYTAEADLELKLVQPNDPTGTDDAWMVVGGDEYVNSRVRSYLDIPSVDKLAVVMHALDIAVSKKEAWR